MQQHELHLPTGATDPFDTAPPVKALPGLKRPNHAFRKKPPSRLDIYEPQFDGCCGVSDRSGHADELEPYRAELARLEVDVEDDQDADHLSEIDHEDDSTPWPV